VRHELLAVADAEHGNAEIEDRGIGGRAFGIVNAARPAGDDDAARGGELGGRGFAGAYFGVDTEIADFAGEQVAVLSSGIEDDDLCGGVQITMLAEKRNRRR
jgi:hypothetical protein